MNKEEKEKMIAALKAKFHRDDYGEEVVDLQDVIAIIQGQSEEEDKVERD